MKKLFIVTLVILTVALVAQVAFGQEETVGPAKGKTEVAIAGSVILSQDSAWAVVGQYGRFTTDNIEVGLGGSLNGADNTDTSGFVFLTGKYHFVNTETPSRTVPYAGLLVGQRFAGGDSDTIWGGSAGVKFFTSEQRAFFVEYDYYQVSGSSSDNASLILFGVSTLY